jgi:hypothetical protein
VKFFARGIEAGTGETRSGSIPKGRKPVPKGAHKHHAACAPNTFSRVAFSGINLNGHASGLRPVLDFT